MSATNLDLPILATADQIRRREFVTVRRGYDPDQVRAYLAQLADQMEQMRSMLREARSEADTAHRVTAQPQPDPYERFAQRVAGVLRAADHEAETIRAEAMNDAERTTRDARTEADRIRTDAQAKAEEARARADTAVRSAREKADRTIAGLAMRRDALVDQLASMQERLVGVAHDLESAMDLKISLPDIAPIAAILDHDDSRASTDGPNAHDAASDDGSADAAGPSATSSEEPDAPRADDPVVVVTGTEPDGPDPDPAYEELWEGTDAIKLDLPDIPALDLDWGEGEASDR